jgi:hypothetical protein
MVCSLIPTKKKGIGTLGWDWNQCVFKVKSISINKFIKANWSQSGAWMKSWKTCIHMIHHNLKLGQITILLPTLYFVMNDRDKVAKFLRIQKNKVSIFKKIVKLWIMHFCGLITPRYKLQLMNFQGKKCRPWRRISNSCTLQLKIICHIFSGFSDWESNYQFD